MFALRFGLACAVMVSTGVVTATEPEIPGPALGVALDGTTIPDGLAATDAAHPMEARVAVDWSTIEAAPGTFDWSAVIPVVTTLTERGMRVTLCVRGASPFLHARPEGISGVPDGEWLAAWTGLLRSAVATLGTRIAVVEIGEHPDASFEPVAYAFVLKSSALAVKAEAKARGLDVRVAQGAVGADALNWQKDLWANDAAPYVDILPVNFAVAADVAAGVAAFSAEAALHPPAAELRAYVAADIDDAWASVRGALRALGAAARSALVTLPADADNAGKVGRLVGRLQARLATDYSPAPVGGLSLREPEGGASEGGVVIARFLHAKDFATLVVYQAKPKGTPDGQARLLLDTIDVKNPEVEDLLSGATYTTGPASVPGEKARALRLLLADHPLGVRWDRASENRPGLDVAAEDVKVQTTRGLTAEEIIAKNRQVQKFQDDHLVRWIAKGRADLHFKVAQGGGSIDVGIDSTYFWRRGEKLEWQQTKYYVNGNLVTWKKIPELPLIQPEKVITLPLDLTFDKTYDYKLAGEDTVERRPAYVVAFEPSATLQGKSLYRGRVWIDKETFVRLRTSVIQTNLEPPVLQNEETDIYVSVTGPDGATYNLIGRIDGQQLWTGGGRNFVVRREVAFSGFEVNAPEERFDQALKDAYASDDQMLRDTDRGFRYLEKQPGGERTVKEKVKSTALFALAGALKDDATSGVVPLLGVNWFDYNFLKKNIQIDVFSAAVFNFVNLTDPSLAGTRVDLGAEASIIALKLEDKEYVNGVEDLTQRVLRRSQYLTGRVGCPLGDFFKVSGIADLTWNAYDDSSDANDALAAQNAANGTSLVYVVPTDHKVYAGTVQLEFNRKGYSIAAAGRASRRSEWKSWGDFDTVTGTFVNSSYDTSQESFRTWKLTTFKEWYLPKFQKIKLGIDYLDGRDLDRFSQYSFDRFGDQRLEGYAGTGVRFDTGFFARTGWAFNILNAVRFDASVEYGRVKDRLQNAPYQEHYGAGLSFNVVGPWKTIWQGSYGRAIRSDIPELEGKQEFMLVVLKLF